MGHNRVLLFLHSHQTHRYEQASRQYDRMAQAAEEIESLIGCDRIEFYVPSPERLLRDDDDCGVRYFVKDDDTPIPMDCCDLTAATVESLRDYADRLLTLAAEIEGAFGKGVL